MKKKSRSKLNFGEEPIETKGSSSVASELSDLSKSITRSLWNDLLGGTAKDAGGQIFGKESESDNNSGDLIEGQEIMIKRMQKEESLKIAQHKEYFRELDQRETVVTRKEQGSMEYKIKQILVELKTITKQSKEMQVVFKQVTTEEVPVNPGKYHVHFFEWLLTFVKHARVRIEESAHWLKAFASRKKEKRYWNMFKKHGTTFGLSNERVVSTQTG